MQNFSNLITTLNGAKIRTQDRHAEIRKRRVRGPSPPVVRISRASDCGPCREPCTPNRTPRVGRVAAMHRLVQRKRKEASPVGGELLLPSLGRRLGRLVEVRLAQRLQKLQVLFAQLTILLSNLGEGWIRIGISHGFRALAKVLLPLSGGILVSEKYRRDRTLDQREMAQDPERVAPAVRCRKRRCGAAHLVDYT